MSVPTGCRTAGTIICRTIAVLTVVLLLHVSCGRRDKGLGDAVTQRDSLSMMTTYGITSLISENGQMKYRIYAQAWDWYDRKDPPYWAFEQGVYLEVLDSMMVVSSSIKADTAYYYINSEKWELRGGVHAENENSEEFDTDLLYWDQRMERVYSDARISIRQEKQVIYGREFESTQDFSHYMIRKSEGMFPVENE